MSSSREYGLDRSQRTRIYLIRHGAVLPEARDRFNGLTDAGLDPEGAAQIARVADYLATAPPTKIFSSPLSRCQDSAAVIAQKYNLEVQVIEELHEMSFGKLEGLSFTESREKYGPEMAAWYQDFANYRFPEAETMTEVQNRVWPVLERIAADNPGTEVAVQAHGAVNRLTICKALGLDLAKVLQLSQDYGCLNILEFWPDRVIVKGINIQPGPTLPQEPFDRS